MTCRQAMQWMDAFLDGEASVEARRDRFAAHLERCAGCRGQWNALQLAESALRAPRPVPAPEGLLQEFRRALAAEEGGQRTVRTAAAPTGFLRWLLPAGAFAAALLLLFALPRLTVGPPPSGAATGTEMARAEPPPFDDSAARGRAASPKLAPEPPAPAFAYGGSGESPSSSRPAPVVSEAGRARTESGRPAMRRARQTPKTRRVDRPLRRDRRALAAALTFGMGGGGSGRPGGVDEVPAGGAAGVSVAGVTTAYGDALPLEFDVSPALLTALQRPVETGGRSLTVQAAVRELSLYADVVVQVDSVAGQRPVAMEQGERPLWQALETVARQGSLQVYPVDNQLVLRASPARSAVMARARRLEDAPQPAPALQQGATGRARGAAGPRGPAAPKPAAPRGPAEGLEPPVSVKSRQDALYHARTVEAVGARPDPSVWPALWGTLPERGFRAPAPEELPPVPRPVLERTRQGSGSQQP